MASPFTGKTHEQNIQDASLLLAMLSITPPIGFILRTARRAARDHPLKYKVYLTLKRLQTGVKE
jgi:hypothetical protein